jgi:hypothetical protein
LRNKGFGYDQRLGRPPAALAMLASQIAALAALTAGLVLLVVVFVALELTESSGSEETGARAPSTSQGNRNPQLWEIPTSDGLGPSTPSLPCVPIGNRSQPVATILAC